MDRKFLHVLLNVDLQSSDMDAILSFRIQE